MKDKPYFAVIYMFVITAFFSAVLIGFSRLTRGKVEANQQLALERAVIQVFPDIEAKNNAEVHQIFTEQFEKSEKDSYIYRQEGVIKGYAVSVEGQGFWAPIKGIIGIQSDQRTITGVAFYEQSETPGLGARIVEADFRNQFIGKQIETTQKPLGIKSSNEQLQKNEVHAITGATQTCVRLEKLVNEGLTAWIKAMENKENQP